MRINIKSNSKQNTENNDTFVGYSPVYLEKTQKRIRRNNSAIKMRLKVTLFF